MNFHVSSIEETISEIVTSKRTVIRFGDGELQLIQGEDIGFQSFNPELKKRLIEVLSCDYPDVMICIPGTLRDISYLNSESRRWWQRYIATRGRDWLVYTRNRTYYNTLVTRLYYDWDKREEAGKRFDSFFKIWENRDVVMVEGELSRVGEGNSLFRSAKKVYRVLCPSTNAFDKYDEILGFLSTLPKEYLILTALGPTAKLLAFDLNRLGYRVIDIGHIDIEYEWFLRKATEKVPIENKNVNESIQAKYIDGKNLSDSYKNSIIKTII